MAEGPNVKPIICLTHPRACSTLFERIFLHHPDIAVCLNEVLSGCFFTGSEALSPRFKKVEAVEFRKKTDLSDITYKAGMDIIFEANEKQGGPKSRVFNKDMARVFLPPPGEPYRIAASYGGGSEAGNPSVVPLEVLGKIHFIFLVRHPRFSIPSFYRKCTPPFNTGSDFEGFAPQDAGYLQLRILLDYLREAGVVGPGKAGEQPVSTTSVPNITLVDAADLLDDPETIMALVCKELDITYSPDILSWEGKEKHDQASEAFRNWGVWHDVVVKSTGLHKRTAEQVNEPSIEEQDAKWRKEYGEEGQKIIRACVDENIPHYEYLRSFAIKI